MQLQTDVRFTSELFTPFLPDDCQVNPGCYGAELAYWVAHKLAAKGIVTSYPDFEDWGWYLEYITSSGEEYWLCFGNAENSATTWHCFLDPKRKGFFGKTAAPENAAPLLHALREVLESEPGIREVHWYEDQEHSE